MEESLKNVRAIYRTLLLVCFSGFVAFVASLQTTKYEEALEEIRQMNELDHAAFLQFAHDRLQNQVRRKLSAQNKSFLNELQSAYLSKDEEEKLGTPAPGLQIPRIPYVVGFPL